MFELEAGEKVSFTIVKGSKIPSGALAYSEPLTDLAHCPLCRCLMAALLPPKQASSLPPRNLLGDPRGCINLLGLP